MGPRRSGSTTCSETSSQSAAAAWPSSATSTSRRSSRFRTSSLSPSRRGSSCLRRSWSTPACPVRHRLLRPTRSASFGDADVAFAQQALIDHCERHADRVALLDPPCGRRTLSVPALAAWRSRFESSYAAMYAPWVVVLDPLADQPATVRAPWGRLRRLPPSGHVAGLIARVDTEIGAWVAPANRLVRWAHSTDMPVGDEEHGILNDADVDALRPQASRGVAVLGARTVASDSSWRFLSVRRLFLLVERTLRAGLAWTVFEPAGPALDRIMGAAITGLLEDLWERGAFAGETPGTSFFVKTGGGDRLRGEVIVEIGIAAQRPAEVIVLQVVRTEDRLELREQPERSV